jgi:hypothetical protein
LTGVDNTKDRLGNVHENVFHFVKRPKGYYYDADAIRSKPREAKIVNGSVISATGVSGVPYSGTTERLERIKQRASVPDMLNPPFTYTSRSSKMHCPFDYALELLASFAPRCPQRF